MVLVDFNAMCGILSTRMNDGFFVFFRLELECLFGTAQHMTAYDSIRDAMIIISNIRTF